MLSHSVVSDFVKSRMVALQAPLSMGFSRQEYWSGLPFPPPGDLPNPGIKPESPKLQAESFPLNHQGNPVESMLLLLLLHRPWDSPGKNTGVGCHFLLQCMKVKGEIEVVQSCRDSMDCRLPGSSIHGIFQARMLEWGAIAFSIYTLLYTK